MTPVFIKRPLRCHSSLPRYPVLRPPLFHPHPNGQRSAVPREYQSRLSEEIRQIANIAKVDGCNVLPIADRIDCSAQELERWLIDSRRREGPSATDSKAQPTPFSATDRWPAVTPIDPIPD
jgi:hypothetical protein